MVCQGPITLKTVCRLTAGRAMFARLMPEEDLHKIHTALKEFVSGKLVPRSVVLGILRTFFLCLDRGSVSFHTSKCQSPCCSQKTWSLVDTLNDCSTYNNVPNKRFKTLLLARHCLHVIMASWTKGTFGQSWLNDSDLPVELTMRMRQWLAMYAVDGFLMCHNICRTAFPAITCEHQLVAWDELQVEESCRRRSIAHHQNVTKMDELADKLCHEVREFNGSLGHPVKVLDMRSSNGNIHGTRTTLNALKLALEKFADSTSDNETCSSSEMDLKPTIKLEVAMVGSSNGAFCDDLLYVVRTSRKYNIDIEISSFRFDDVSPALMSQIIQSLSNPKLVRQLHFRNVKPTCLFEAREALRYLTGLEEFSLSTCAFQPIAFTAEETAIFWRDIVENWPKLRWLEVSRVRFTIPNTSDLKIPSSLRYLELSEGSVTVELLRWLSRHFREKQTIRSLRFLRETALASRRALWDSLIELIAISKASLTTLSVDHCCLTDNHCDELRRALTPNSTSSPSFVIEGDQATSSIKNLTIREPHASWHTVSDIFTSVLSSFDRQPAFPKFEYFSALVPRMSEISLWPGVFLSPESETNDDGLSDKGDPRIAYEEKLASIAREKGRKVKIDLFWEPECDWT